MKMIEVIAQRSIKVTEDDIDDIVSTALDSIDYWADRVQIVGGNCLGEYASQQISRGGELDVYEQDEDKPYRLNLGKLLQGIRLWYEQGYDRYGALQPNGDLDCGEIDGEMADIIVQFALFGDVQYG